MYFVAHRIFPIHPCRLYWENDKAVRMPGFAAPENAVTESNDANIVDRWLRVHWICRGQVSNTSDVS
ncbi:hypothetical protein GCM10007207_24710 [Asaia siamensis]|uniref:Uncharacterized protein n=1 Tax=Asaia siamensis TaxID=110479 RepID=A0ABQ1MBY4_9PROT|nr:hypothetical protein AA0323_0349 [Asaia siamensis NRIC 0323]GGC38192.1 hypothetical protein GCM10007207_24710 [Asaia siamensis]